MKKLMLVLAIGAFAACNDNTSGEGSTRDTVPAALPVDSNTIGVTTDTTASAPVVDTTKVVDTLKK